MYIYFYISDVRKIVESTRSIRRYKRHLWQIHLLNETEKGMSLYSTHVRGPFIDIK